jgi:hypothetical protein
MTDTSFDYAKRKSVLSVFPIESMLISYKLSVSDAMRTRGNVSRAAIHSLHQEANANLGAAKDRIVVAKEDIKVVSEAVLSAVSRLIRATIYKDSLSVTEIYSTPLPSLSLRNIAHKLNPKSTISERFMGNSSAAFATTLQPDRRLANAHGMFPRNGRPRNRERRSWNDIDPTLSTNKQADPTRLTKTMRSCTKLSEESLPMLLWTQTTTRVNRRPLRSRCRLPQWMNPYQSLRLHRLRRLSTRLSPS